MPLLMTRMQIAVNGWAVVGPDGYLTVPHILHRWIKGKEKVGRTGKGKSSLKDLFGYNTKA